MKISCDACQAKYSISDDKVQGKVFKIRCKKCTHIIVVRGAVAAEPAASEPVADAPWHLVIDQNQVGPLSAAEVERRFATGEIDAETFTWREGLADWLPLAEIDAFASLGRTAEAPIARAAVSPRPAGASDGELFAASATGATTAAKLRGERNESSVLFSLNNLSELAVAPRRAPAATPASATPAATATAGEGSGLIDIRSMANAYIGGGAPVATIKTAPGSFADLPVFGGGSGFAEPAAIVPVATRPTDRKLVYIMITAVALLAIIATILVVLLVGNDTHEQVVATAPREPAPAVAPSAPPAAAPSAPAPTAVAAVAPASPPTAPPRPAATNHVATRPTPTTNASSHPIQTPAALHPTAPAATNECEEVQCVLDGYASECCKRFRHTPPPPPAPDPTTRSNLPDSIDRAMISSAVDAVKPRVMTCGNKSPAKGKVVVKVTVAGAGSVKSVAIESTPDAALGACVAAAVQKASFSATQHGGSFRVPFTF